MVVSGLPRRNGDRHSAEIANMALDLLNEMERFVVKHDPDLHLQLRSGIHIGPCAAGNSEKNAISNFIQVLTLTNQDQNMIRMNSNVSSSTKFKKDKLNAGFS